MNIALIGCGGWGRNLARNLHEIGALGYVVDPSDAARELAASFGVEHRPEYEDVLRDPAIDGVMIATPAVTHFDIASAALNASKGVFVEKPIALNTKHGRALSALAQEQGQVLMVGHLLQYHPVFIALKALVEADTLGPVGYISSSRASLGKVRTEENVIWSFSPHDISMVLALAGTMPEAVSAHATYFLPQDIADIGTVHLRWANGLRADITASWLSPAKEQKLTVTGSRATAVFSDTETWNDKLKLHHNSVKQMDGVPRAVSDGIEVVPVEPGEPLRNEVVHFLDCLAIKARPRTDGEEATRVLAVLQCAEASLAADNSWISVARYL